MIQMVLGHYSVVVEVYVLVLVKKLTIDLERLWSGMGFKVFIYIKVNRIWVRLSCMCPVDLISKTLLLRQLWLWSMVHRSKLFGRHCLSTAVFGVDLR